MRLNLKEFVVVKNAEGEVNVNALKPEGEKKEPKKRRAPAEPKKKAKAPEMQIDSLRLKIGKVVYKDYSRGGGPFVREFDVNVDEEYKDIDSPRALIKLIMVKALAGTAVSKLAGIDINELKGAITDTLSGAVDIIPEETAREARAAAQDAAKKTEEAARKAQETLQKTTEELKDRFKLPFGGE